MTILWGNSFLIKTNVDRALRFTWFGLQFYNVHNVPMRKGFLLSAFFFFFRLRNKSSVRGRDFPDVIQLKRDKFPSLSGFGASFWCIHTLMNCLAI